MEAQNSFGALWACASYGVIPKLYNKYRSEYFTECEYAPAVKRPGFYNCMDIKTEQHIALPKHIYSVTLLSTERVSTGH